VEESGGLGVAILASCEWETSVIGQPVAKVLFLAADSYNIALTLAGELRNHAIKQHMAFVGAAPEFSPAYIVCALEHAGFHLVAQYYLWVAKTRDVITTARKLAQMYPCRFATPADAAAVASIAEDPFVYGRYLADPCLPREMGKRLYHEWAANSCRGYADVVIVYESNNEVMGFVTGKIESPGQTAWVDLVAVRDQERGGAVGIALLAKLFLWCAEQSVESIRIDTQKPNIEINRIYRHFGFNIEDSGLVLHWCPSPSPGLHSSRAATVG
jgi:GNAT superfamily N-acetyltransferase